MEHGTSHTEAPRARSLRERQREERAALILLAAQEVFAEKGYHDASIDEIAARTGVAKGTVYLHFASKQDLLAALLEQEFMRFIACVDRVSGDTRSVRARIEQLFLYVYERMQAKRNQVLLEQHTGIGITRQVLESRAGLQDQIAQVLQRITALLEAGKRDGELDPGVPTPIMLATFVALISPSGYEHLLTTGEVSPATLVAHVSRIFFPNHAAPQRETTNG